MCLIDPPCKTLNGHTQSLRDMYFQIRAARICPIGKGCHPVAVEQCGYILFHVIFPRRSAMPYFTRVYDDVSAQAKCALRDVEVLFIIFYARDRTGYIQFHVNHPFKNHRCGGMDLSSRRPSIVLSKVKTCERKAEEY